MTGTLLFREVLPHVVRIDTEQLELQLLYATDCAAPMNLTSVVL